MVQPLLQIHNYCESEVQQEIKKNIRDIARTNQRQIQDDYDLSTVKHPDWVSKIKESEHDMLLGVISALALGM